MVNTSENMETEISEAGIKRCLAPGEDEWVNDYYNLQLSEEREQFFEDHLFDCERCQDILLMLDSSYTELRAMARESGGSEAEKKRAVKARSREA